MQVALKTGSAAWCRRGSRWSRIQDRRTQDKSLLEEEEDPQSPEAKARSKSRDQHNKRPRAMSRTPKAPPARRSPRRKEAQNLGNPASNHA